MRWEENTNILTAKRLRHQQRLTPDHHTTTHPITRLDLCDTVEVVLIKQKRCTCIFDRVVALRLMGRSSRSRGRSGFIVRCTGRGPTELRNVNMYYVASQCRITIAHTAHICHISQTTARVSRRREKSQRDRAPECSGRGTPWQGSGERSCGDWEGDKSPRCL
jgi:hypothetical protein